MKRSLITVYATVFYIAKSVFDFITNPVILLMASGALLLRAAQIAW